MVRGLAIAVFACLIGACSGTVENNDDNSPSGGTSGASSGAQTNGGVSGDAGTNGSNTGTNGSNTGTNGTTGGGANTGTNTGTNGSSTTGGTTNGGSTGTGTTGSSGSTTAGQPGPTWRVEGTQLLDPCGEPMVLRGVNHPTMYVDRGGDAFPEISSIGANSVRLFWFAGNGVAISELGPAVDRAIEEGMLPMLEMHDSTCKWELDPIVSYWTSKEAVDFIQKREGNFLLNIANEADTDDDAQFLNDYKAAIKKIRDAGIRVPIVIDGSGCGRDYPGLFAAAPALLASDPLHNVIFSAHWYDPTTASAVTEAFQEANDLGIHFIIGEFAHKSPGPQKCAGPSVPYLQVIREADKFDIGWLAWSWGDDDESTWWNADCAEFDMTRTFAASTLERWGLEVAKTDMASIQKTASRTRWLTAGTCN